MSAFDFIPSASVYSDGSFFLVMTLSGKGMMRFDMEAGLYSLPSETSSNELGEAVISALSKSRQIEINQLGEFFDFARSKSEYEAWVLHAMEMYGIKSRRSFFKGLKSCGIRMVGGFMEFEPTRQVKAEAWEGMSEPGVENVLVPCGSNAEEVGRALRLALERCR